MGMWITYQYIEHQVMPPYRKYIKANPELEMIAPFECVATNQGCLLYTSPSPRDS